MDMMESDKKTLCLMSLIPINLLPAEEARSSDLQKALPSDMSLV